MSHEEIVIKSFANNFQVSNKLNEEKADYLQKMVISDRERFYKIIGYFKNYQIMNESVTTKPVPLDFFESACMVGWKSRIAIEGYDEMEKHFSCNKSHEPYPVDWKYVKRTIRRWWNSRKESK